MSTLIEDRSVESSRFSFEQTVPRSLVHKSSLDNVLLTEIKSVAEDRFICAGRIPTAHGFFNSAGRTPRKDILFYTELGRQASLAISHMFMGAGRDEVFIFEGSTAAITAGANLKPASGSIITEIQVSETQRRRNGAVTKIVAEQNMSIDGRHVFKGEGAWSIQPAALFQRLRRMSAVRASAPPAISLETAPRRRNAQNVVITTPEFSRTGGEAISSLIVDESHAYFFDHPCDHVPGMLLLEGCAQLAVAAIAEDAAASPADLWIAGYGVNFAQFVEPGIPVTLTARLVETAETNDSLKAAVRVDISQQDVVSGTTTMTVAFSN
jgi:hypothetical protein